VDGAGADGLVLSVDDGTDDVDFGGNIDILGGKIFRNGGQIFYDGSADGFTGSFFIGESGGSLSHVAGNEGYGNCCFGAGAGQNLEDGESNLAIGSISLQFCTSGGNNVAMGARSVGSVTTGSGNAAIGFSSLRYVTTTGWNVGIGEHAGRYHGSGTDTNQTPSFSVYIGYDVRAGAAAGTNEIVIGKQAVGGGSNTATIGNTNQTDCFIAGEITPSIGYKSSDGTQGATADYSLTGGGTLHVKDGLVTGYTP
jgi:hypothetical protein